MPPALEAQSLNHWTTREDPVSGFQKAALVWTQKGQETVGRMERAALT